MSLEAAASLLAQAAFMAEASSSSIDSDKISSGKSDSKPPPYNGKALLDDMNADLDAMVSRWEGWIRKVAHTSVGELTPGQLRYWVLVANEGRSLSDVSDRLGVDAKIIAAIRERDERNPATGKKRKGPGGRPPFGLK